MAIAANLGFPRIGANRELKKGLERYWAGSIDRAELESIACDIRRTNWQLQQEAGIESVPSNDFSYYDQVLDACALLGAVPNRFKHPGGLVDLDTYFHMARGKEEKEAGQGTAAMEMTKWFDTNYHYIVPEFEAGQSFALSSSKPIDEFREAKQLGLTTRPVLLGPVSFLLLGKGRDVEPLELLPKLLPVYAELLSKLEAEGADWVQLDEPCLVLDLEPAAKAAFERAYRELAEASSSVRLLLATYFGGLRENLDLAASLPVDGLHADLVREPDQLDALQQQWSADRVLSVGIVDGRNIWRNDLGASLKTLRSFSEGRDGDKLWIAPSCSLLHVPVDLDQEKGLDALRPWLAFGKQKLAEVATLTRGLNDGPDAIDAAVREAADGARSRSESKAVHDDRVQRRLSELRVEDAQRNQPFPERREAQHAAWNQPLLPTTTIGSFPQTQEIRRQRARYRKGEIDQPTYETFLEQEIEQAIREQEAIGLDMLVHGEPERNDMVQYFGEQLSGIGFTEHGWVQSYGSRCVRPPIIYGDVSRPAAMTVGWSRFAQSLTDRPVKGMLTGPVTILQWSFVRDDQPRRQTCRQIALAIRDEVTDLEAAGIRAIQIDEPAIREGLPLRRGDWPDYLNWAVECFRLASCGVADATQIHTHMCYSEFNDMIEAIADMDADVISIEASRSQMELLDAFREHRYPNEIGPGVYDIHSPRVPTAEEMRDHLERALQYLAPEQVWVNPDCGLKTRRWEEVRPALKNMVEAAQSLRPALKGQPT